MQQAGEVLIPAYPSLSEKTQKVIVPAIKRPRSAENTDRGYPSMFSSISCESQCGLRKSQGLDLLFKTDHWLPRCRR